MKRVFEFLKQLKLLAFEIAGTILVIAVLYREVAGEIKHLFGRRDGYRSSLWAGCPTQAAFA